MNKLQAVFLDKASLAPEDLDFTPLNDVARWQWFDNAKVSDIQHCLLDVEIIVSNKVVLDRQLIADSKQLKLICVAATGFNNIDVDAAKQHGVTVCNVRAYATASVVQHVFSLMLSLSRKLFPYKESVIRGDWAGTNFFCYFEKTISELGGKTLGIIGYGELGQAVAKVAKCFGMKVSIAHSFNTNKNLGVGESRVDLSTLLATADVVTLHCPLTKNNQHMINEQTLAMMKPESILINTARGGLVDEDALLYALKNNQIGAAGLDVLEQEPPSANNALINYQADNLIITPHIAWASRESRQRLVDEIAKNIRAYQRGEPRNIVI